MPARPTFDHRTPERDACGIGFVATLGGGPSRALADTLLVALERVRHRGALGADHRTGDGAGVLLPIPDALRPNASLGVAMAFLRDGEGRRAVEDSCAREGITVQRWRPVPVEPDALGPWARESAPLVVQALLEPPGGADEEAAERAAFRARKRLDGRPDVYLASLSFRTVVYKALCAADQLADFYPDLRDPALEIGWGIFHQRFSTNTAPSWERAQPFRLLCHNGEINTIRGNVNWMRARCGVLEWDPEESGPLLDETSSDSGMLDNALELVVRGGRDVRHAMTMLVPPAWQSHRELAAEVREFYRYHAGVVEPWDGPAAVVFTDGRVVGAALDRNGLRPMRYVVSEDGFVGCASEAGVFDLPDGVRARRGRLGPGEISGRRPRARGRARRDDQGAVLRRARPYGEWLRDWRRSAASGDAVGGARG